MKMKTRWLAIPAMALAIGLASFTPVSSAQQAVEGFRFEEFFRMADVNKDGMMTRQEFMDAAGKRYDAVMHKMKSSGDAGKSMMKGDVMTREGARMLYMEFHTFGS